MLKNCKKFSKELQELYGVLENMPYSEKLKMFNPFSLSKRWVRNDLIMICKHLKEEEISDSRCFFNLAEKSIIRCNYWTLKIDRFILGANF